MNIAVITGASSGLGVKFLDAALEQFVRVFCRVHPQYAL